MSNDIGSWLEAGDNPILFPEGTGGDGNRVRPFFAGSGDMDRAGQLWHAARPG